ncbi:MAG: ABC transporter ATP-binding protein [Pseudomonadota bacterium]
MSLADRAASAEAAPSSSVALQVRGISKRFGDANVLENVDFDLRWGEVLALLGENGAGKSTLMNILTGIYAADTGQVEVDGAAAEFRSPSDAMALGIGMVRQHLKLVLPFTGRENLRLASGASDTGIDWATLDVRISVVLERTGLDVDLDIPVSSLSVAERQRIEIIKALLLGARILILDEPTAALTDQESERLLQLMRDLVDSGHAIVFITHKLREVVAAGDRVSTLRHGNTVMSGHTVADVTSAELSTAMMGEQQAHAVRRHAAPLTTPMLEVSGMSVSYAGVQILSNASLTLHAGEILGLAGVGGNGQRELAEALMGLRPASGQTTLSGTEIDSASDAERRSFGMRYVPADRTGDALSPNNPVADNLAATAVRTGMLGKRFISPGTILRHARGMIEAFGIAGTRAGGRRPIRLLSGGNAQKSVLARELDLDAKLIIAHSPTRGLDVAACRYVHDRLIRAAERGDAVLLISEDLEEILVLLDHIHVMSRGTLSTTADARPKREDIGALMLGHV